MIAHAVDPTTLNEVFADLHELTARIRQLDVLTHQGGRTREWFELADEQIVLLLATGELDEALGYGHWAVEWARCAGDRYAEQRQLAEARLAHVQQRRGEYLESTMSFVELLGGANQFAAATEAMTCHLAGRNDYAQGIWADASRHFLRAVHLRLLLGDPAAVAESTLALRAALRRHKQEVA